MSQAGGDGVGEATLVVGGAGFVGRALVRRLLDEGRTVRVLDRAPRGDLDPRVELHCGDVCSPTAVLSAVSGVDTVFHLAASIALYGVARPAERKTVMDVNVGGTERLLRSARQHGVRRFVFTSSNNVCLGSRPIAHGDESAPYASRFVDLYSESKAAAERAVRAADSPGGLRTCVLRPGGLWGPGPGALMLEKFLLQLARGRLWAGIGDGRCLADNTHVDNLVEGLWLAERALETRPEVVGGQAYFITDDEPMDPFEWFAPLGQALGYPLPKRRLNARAMYALGLLGECTRYLTGREPLLTRVEVLKVTRSHAFRIDRARRELGYAPHVDRARGMPACLPYARQFLDRARTQA